MEPPPRNRLLCGARELEHGDLKEGSEIVQLRGGKGESGCENTDADEGIHVYMLVLLLLQIVEQDSAHSYQHPHA